MKKPLTTDLDISSDVFNDPLIMACAKQIDEYASQISALEMTVLDLNIQMNASPFYNFRDALNHFRRMCEKYEEENETIRQQTSIEEHLYRGVKDTLIHMITVISRRVESMLNRSLIGQPNSRKGEIAQIYNEIRNIELDLRDRTDTYMLRDLDGILKIFQASYRKLKEKLNEWDFSNLLNQRTEYM